MSEAMDQRRRERFVDTEQCSLVMLGPNYSPVFRARHIKLDEARQLLARELHGDEEFRQVWMEAKQQFEQSNRRPVKQDDDLVLCIIAYTLEDPIPLYRRLNEQCRELGDSDDAWERFPYRGWWCMLHQALTKVPNSPPLVWPAPTGPTTRSLPQITCYRGLSKNVEFTNSQIQHKQFFAFNCFASTSTNESKAKKFVGENGTLFEFKTMPLAALGIQQYSAFPEEEEVLVWPWSTFNVVGITKDGSITRVKLSSSGPIVY